MADPLVEAIKWRIPNIKVGDGTDPANHMGPLITEAHRNRVASYIENAPAEGATVLIDGRHGAPEEGFFLRPSLIDGVRPGMNAYDEIFGPVLGITRADTYQEAVALVNENPFGNGAAILYARRRCCPPVPARCAGRLVGVDVPIPVPVAYYSFGGRKNSLFGDLRIYGAESIDFYTQSKVVTSRWP